MIELVELNRIAAPIERVFDLSLSIDVHVLGNHRYGEQAVALGAKTTGVMRLNDEVTWQARHLFVRQRLTTRITEYDRPHAFQDTMQRGTFAWMQHDHFFRAMGPGETEMRDVFRFAAPLGVLGWVAERVLLAGYMRSLLTERNRVLRGVAESDDWQQFLRD